MNILTLFACVPDPTDDVVVPGDDVSPPGLIDDDGDGFTEEDGDCDDAQPSMNPMATDLVGDGYDQNCDGTDGTDGDADGYPSELSGGDDCDDADPATFVGAIEVWYDGKDQGCVGEAWVGDGDQDGDGVDSEFVVGKDCDDTDALIHPWVIETNGNGEDDNCNGVVDDFYLTLEWHEGAVYPDPVLTATLTDINYEMAGARVSLSVSEAVVPIEKYDPHDISAVSDGLDTQETSDVAYGYIYANNGSTLQLEGNETFFLGTGGFDINGEYMKGFFLCWGYDDGSCPVHDYILMDPTRPE